MVVYVVGVGISGLKWLSSIGLGYWSGVVMVVVLRVIGFGCRCGSMSLVCVLCDCLGENTVLVW